MNKLPASHRKSSRNSEKQTGDPNLSICEKPESEVETEPGANQTERAEDDDKRAAIKLKNEPIKDDSDLNSSMIPKKPAEQPAAKLTSSIRSTPTEPIRFQASELEVRTTDVVDAQAIRMDERRSERVECDASDLTVSTESKRVLAGRFGSGHTGIT